MKSSLFRRASLAALVLVTTVAPAVAAQSDGAAARTESVVKSRIGAQARLLGEKIVPHKLAFQGTTVGGLSGSRPEPVHG